MDQKKNNTQRQKINKITIRTDGRKHPVLLSSLLSDAPPPITDGCVPWQQPGESSNRLPSSPNRNHLQHPSILPFSQTPLLKFIFMPCFKVHAAMRRSQFSASPAVLWAYVTASAAWVSVCLCSYSIDPPPPSRQFNFTEYSLLRCFLHQRKQLDILRFLKRTLDSLYLVEVKTA